MASLFESIASTILILPITFGYLSIIALPLVSILGGTMLILYCLLRQSTTNSEVEQISNSGSQLHIVPSAKTEQSQQVEKRTRELRPSPQRSWNTYEHSEVS